MWLLRPARTASGTGLGFASLINFMAQTGFDRETSIIRALRGAVRQNGVSGS